MRKFTKVAGAAILATTAMTPIVAHAQNIAADADAADEAREAEEAPAGEIYVTARKSNESLTEVPVAVTAITGADIEAAGIADMNDIASFTPGLRNQNQSIGRNDRGYKQYVIRGVVPGSASSSRQAVTLFVDGAPVSGGNFEGVTNVERVEVVRGPQSAFFGRATFAGAINIVTAPPSYDWGGQVDLEYSRFDTYDMKASVEGPIIEDVLSFRLGGHRYHTDGQYQDVVYPGERLGERDTKSVNLALRFEPAYNLQFRVFGVAWEDDDGLPANARYNQSTWNCNGGAAAEGSLNWTCGELSGYPADTVTWIQDLNLDAFDALDNGLNMFGPGFIDHLGLHREAKQVRASMDWDLGEWNVSALGAWSQNKWNFMQTLFGDDLRDTPSVGSAGLPYAYTLILGGPRDEDTYGEVRLTTPRTNPIWATVGMNYLDADYEVTTTAYSGNGYLTVTPRLYNNTKTIGLFGSLNYDVTDALHLSAEARYQWDKQLQITYAGTQPRFENTFKSFSPRLIANYDITDDAMVYASFSRGTRPGQFNSSYYSQSAYVQAQIDEQANVTGVVPEDKLEMYEAGVKGWFFDRSLRILASAYIGKWKDRHIPSTVLYYVDEAAREAGLLSQLIVTAPSGKVDLSGFELEMLFTPHPDWTIEGTFGYAATDIRNTYSADALAVTGDASPVGTQLPYYPEKQGSFSVTWEHPVSSSVTPFVRGDALYTDKIYATEANLSYIPENVKFNLRAGAFIDNIRLEVFGENIFDNRAPSSVSRVAYNEYSATGSTTSVNGIIVSLADRATYGVRASFDF